MTSHIDPWMLDLAAVAVRRRTGLIYPESRRDALRDGLLRVMARYDVATPVGLLARADEDEALFDELVAELTVGETYFLRDANQFDLIRITILHDLLGRGRGGLRVWSAGCATGAEPYSLAMLLREAAPGRPHHVLGTDLSRHALARARRGRYSEWALRAVPDAVRVRYFRRVDGRWELADVLKAMVDFRFLNLADDTYPSLATGTNGMDLILCRNVLIYLDEAACRRVARRLVASLQPDGWLILGAADPPIQDWADCEVHATDAGLAYRRKRLSGVPPSPLLPSSHLPSPHLPLDGGDEREGDEADEAAVLDGAPISHLDPDGGDGREGDKADEASVLTAADWYSRHDYARAAATADHVVRRDGGVPDDWALLIRAHANTGDLDAAGEACVEALERHSLSPELNYLQAVLLLEMDRSADAAAAARRALYLDRRYVMAHVTLADALARLGAPSDARRALRTASDLLRGMAPGQDVAGADGEPAERIAAMVRARQAVLGEVAV